jgi:hypothetical protein
MRGGEKKHEKSDKDKMVSKIMKMKPPEKKKQDEQNNGCSSRRLVDHQDQSICLSASQPASQLILLIPTHSLFRISLNISIIIIQTESPLQLLIFPSKIVDLIFIFLQGIGTRGAKLFDNLEDAP